VISISDDESALDDGSRLESSTGIVISMLWGIEGAGEGKRPLVLELVATVDLGSRGQ
jgi:hypothetical protein